MRGTLGFSVLAIFKSVFRFLCRKTSVFRFWCPLRFADFPLFSIYFQFSRKILTGFRIWYPMRFSVFPIWPIWVRLLFDLSGNYAPSLISNSRETQMLLRGMRNKPIQISQGSFSSPREAVPSPPPLVNWKRRSLAFVSPWGEGRVRVHVGQSLGGSRVLNDAQDFDHL